MINIIKVLGTKSAAEPDQVLINVIYSQLSVHDENVPAALQVLERHIGRDGITRFVFPTASLSAEAGEPMQTAFETHCLAQANEVIESGIDFDLLAMNSAMLNVVITLQPISADAAVTITPDIIRAWQALPVSFAISCI